MNSDEVTFFIVEDNKSPEGIHLLRGLFNEEGFSELLVAGNPKAKGTDWFLDYKYEHLVFSARGAGSIGVVTLEDLGGISGRATCSAHIGLRAAYRSPRWSTSVAALAKQHLYNVGFEGVLGYILNSNKAAQRFALRSGFEIVGSYTIRDENGIQHGTTFGWEPTPDRSED